MSYLTNKFDKHLADLLIGGAVGLMPSDTIYGLSCLALNKSAVERLRQIKKRSAAKRFIVLISDLNQLGSLGLDENEAQALTDYWPGSVSLEMKASKSPEWLRQGANTFAVRMPDRQDLHNFINQVGPITSTSANYEGEEPVKNVREAMDKFGEQLDFYADMGEIVGRPSTMVRVDDGKLEVIRQGSVIIKKEDM